LIFKAGCKEIADFGQNSFPNSGIIAGICKDSRVTRVTRGTRATNPAR